MKYKLITTKKGQVPIDEIKEGDEVLSHGTWVAAPKPVMGEVSICEFETLPETSFEKKFIYKKKEVFCNHRPVLNEFEKDRTGLSVRGYLHETRKKNTEAVNMNSGELRYWYPRLIDFFDRVVFPVVKPGAITFTVYEKFPNLVELKGNELSERNLEYYLEGLLRRRMAWWDNSIRLPQRLDETDKIVLRLLDIDCIKVKDGNRVSNPISLLKHVRDDFNKTKLTDDIIRLMLLKSYDLPQYTPGCKIMSRKDGVDWILPGVNPDINCLSPYEHERFDKTANPQVRNKIRTVKVDKLGKVYKNDYNKNNLYEKFLGGQSDI